LITYVVKILEASFSPCMYFTYSCRVDKAERAHHHVWNWWARR